MSKSQGDSEAPQPWHTGMTDIYGAGDDHHISQAWYPHFRSYQQPIGVDSGDAHIPSEQKKSEVEMRHFPVQQHANLVFVENPSTSSSGPYHYLVLAVLMTCVLPVFGIPAIVFSLYARTQYRRGNVQQAWRYSKVSLLWSLGGLAFATVLLVTLGLAACLQQNGIISLFQASEPGAPVSPDLDLPLESSTFPPPTTTSTRAPTVPPQLMEIIKMLPTGAFLDDDFARSGDWEYDTEP